MKNKKVMKSLIKRYNNIDFDYKTCEKGQGNLSAQLEFNGIPGSVLLDITVYDSGKAYVFFVFDRVEECFNLYDLINEYNAESLFYTLSLRENENGTFLEASSNMYLISDEKEIFDNICFLIEYLNSEENLELLSEVLSYIQE